MYVHSKVCCVISVVRSSVDGISADISTNVHFWVKTLLHLIFGSLYGISNAWDKLHFRKCATRMTISVAVQLWTSPRLNKRRNYVTQTWHSRWFITIRSLLNQMLQGQARVRRNTFMDGSILWTRTTQLRLFLYKWSLKDLVTGHTHRRCFISRYGFRVL